MSYLQSLSEIGTGIIGRSVTATLYVSPTGSNSNGMTWATAYNTIQAALDAASTDANACTLIMIGPHSTNYDINRTGDPMWAGNYIIAGAARSWSTIKNTHPAATSIMKFTGKTMVSRLDVNLGTGNNGLIMTNLGAKLEDCQFVGEDLEAAKTALHLDGATTIKHCRVDRCHFIGHVTHMTGILIDNCTQSTFKDCRIHDCKTGIQIVGADSDINLFDHLDIGDCALALDIDAGNEQHFDNIILHNNTLNIDDEVGDHTWQNICGHFNVTMEPDNLTGTQVDTHANANTWGADTEIRAAVASTKPFRIVGITLEPSVGEWFRIRFSADSGATFYDDILFDANKHEGSVFPSGTEFIFNAGTRISASAQSLSGGDNTKVWIEVQSI